MSGKSKAPSRKAVDVDPTVAAANAAKRKERMEALQKKDEERFEKIQKFVEEKSVPSSAYTVISAIVKKAHTSLQECQVELKTDITGREFRYKDHGTADASLVVAYKKQLRMLLNAIKQTLGKTKSVMTMLETDQKDIFEDIEDDTDSEPQA